MSLYGEESKCRTQTCPHFWAISSVRLLTVEPTLVVSAGNDDSTRDEAQVGIFNDTRIKACLRRLDDNVYTRVEFLKAVGHSMGAHSCDLYTESTDSDSDSPDDDQASADAGATTVNAADANETDYCEVCLVAQHEPRLAKHVVSPGAYWKWLPYLPCGH